MNTAFEDSLRWIEQICIDLDRNPAAATRAIEEFRDSPQALEICWALLQSGRASQPAEFHILSSAKHALLFKWDALSADYRQQWIQWLEGSLHHRVSSGQPNFLINKFIEVYVSIRKRSWLLASAEEKSMLMAFLGSCLDHASMPFQFLGATLLLYLVEEFQKTTSADVGVAMSFYVQTKSDFQVHTLPTILSLCWKKISLLTIAGQSDTTIFTLCGILLKTITEIISWEYTSYDYVNQTLQEDLSSTIHKPPAHFGNVLLQSVFVDKVFEIYKAARAVQHAGTSDVDGTILEVRNLITAMSCINGEIFPSDESKTQFANYLFTQICMVTEPHINRRTLQLLTVECDDYEEGGVRAEEMALLLQTFQHLLTNFSLSIVVSMPYFTNMMSVMGQLSMVICQEIDVLTADVRVRMQRSDFRDIAEIGIDNTWRFDIFTQSLDVWTTIQDAFALVYQSTMLEMSSLVSNGQFVSAEAQVHHAQLQQTLTSMQQFRRWLMTISEELFPRTFDCILMVLVNDCLAAAEEMTGEELERIDERVMEHLLIGTASLGRLHAISSISLIGNRLQGFVQDYSSIYEQYNLLHSGVPLPPPATITASANTSTGNGLGTTANSSNEMLMESWSTKNLFCLENVRVCLLLLHFLLVDDYSMVDPDGAFHPQSKVMGALRSTAGSGNTNGGSTSTSGGETPQISSWILQSLQDDPAQMVLLFDAFRLTASLLQLQVQMLSTPLSPSLSSSAISHPSISPLLLTTIFRFFSSTTVRYLDPKSDSYSDDTLRMFPFLVNNGNASASLFFSSPEIPLIYDLLLSSYGVIVQRLPLETDLILASSRALVLMAEHVPSHRVYQLLSSRSEILIHLVAAYDTLVKSTLPRQYAMKIPVISSSVRHLLPANVSAEATGMTGGLNVGCLANGKSIMSRLSDEGMIMVTEALGRLILHSPDPQHHLLFRSICESLYNSLSTLQSLSSSGEIDGLVALTSVNLVLAAVSGIIRCSAMLDVELDAIYQLSFTAWQWIAWHLNSHPPTQPSFPPTKDSSATSLATIYTCGQVLRDFAEFQLGKLSSSTATGVGAKHDLRTQVVQGYYHALVLLLQSYGRHLQPFVAGDIRILPTTLTNANTHANATGNVMNAMSSHHFGSASFYEPVADVDTSQWEKHVHQMLDILNQVSEKEFFISESKVSGDALREVSQTANANNNVDAYLEDLGSVLCLGLETVNPLLSLPILRVYPALMQQYIAFIAYLCGGEVDGLVRWLVMRGHQFPALASVVNSHPTYPTLGASTVINGSNNTAAGTNYMQNLLWQLYEAALQSHDPATARQALQALQNLLQQQFRLFGQLVAPTSAPAMRQNAEQMLLIQPQHRDVWSSLLHEMTRTILLSSFSATAVTRSVSGNNNNNATNASSSNNRQLPADRIDSFSSAFFALVLFTNHVDRRLMSVTAATTTLTVDELRVLQLVVQNVLTNPEQSTIYFTNNNLSVVSANLSWTPAMQTTVWTMLRALFMERNVSLMNLDKKNRMEFTKNFRDFLRQLRSLSSA